MGSCHVVSCVRAMWSWVHACMGSFMAWSCVHGFVPFVLVNWFVQSCGDKFMYSWVDAFMNSWVHVFMGLCMHVLIGSRGHRSMGWCGSKMCAFLPGLWPTE